MKDSKEQFNEEPVEYCTCCLSLAIRDMDGTPYCDKCGSTHISSANIHDWENEYHKRYGTYYVNKK